MIKCHEVRDCRRYCYSHLVDANGHTGHTVHPCPAGEGTLKSRQEDCLCFVLRLFRSLTEGLKFQSDSAWKAGEQNLHKQSAIICYNIFRIRNPCSCKALFPIKSHHTGFVVNTSMTWPIRQKLLNGWHKGHICGVGGNSNMGTLSELSTLGHHAEDRSAYLVETIQKESRNVARSNQTNVARCCKSLQSVAEKTSANAWGRATKIIMPQAVLW